MFLKVAGYECHLDAVYFAKGLFDVVCSAKSRLFEVDGDVSSCRELLNVLDGTFSPVPGLTDLFSHEPRAS
jgi:hypothetical protein